MQGLSIGLIYSYEPIEQLQRCVQSLQNDLRDFSLVSKVQWILICTPQAAENDFSFFPGEVTWSPSHNLGWNRNFALSKATEEAFYFTDPDCWLEPGSLRKLCEAFETNRKSDEIFAVAGSNFLHSRNPQLQKAFRWIGRTKLLNGGSSQIKIANQNRLDWHSPTCHILYDRNKLKGFHFSSRFSRVGEDLELHFRLQQSGKRILICSNAPVWHEQPEDLKLYLRKVFFYGTAQTHLLRSWPSGILNRRLLMLALFLAWSFLFFSIPENFKWVFVSLSFIVGWTVLAAEVLFYDGEKEFLFFSYFFALVAGAYLTGQISGLVWPLPSMQSEESKWASKPNS